MQKKMGLFSLQSMLIIWLPIVMITVFHYSTEHTLHWIHDILRRLYYLPIIVAAFMFGKKGAFSASAAISIIYFPHAFTSLLNRDPAGTVDKALEIVLYNVIGLITGILAENIEKEKNRYQLTAENLEEKIIQNKELEEQLVRTEKLKALGEMTAGLAHEIKNPLASIKGSAEIIGDEIPDDSPKKKMVAIQKKEIERLQHLLERFLSFARPQKVDMEQLDLRDIAAHSVDMVSAQINQQNITLTYQESDTPQYVHGNRENLTQVLINLLLNAIDAVGNEGAISVVLEEEIERKQHYIKLVVSDNGSGISPEAQRQIFNPFFTTKQQGTGLGLSIVSRIIEEHGGRITLKSDKNGTSFIIYF